MYPESLSFCLYFSPSGSFFSSPRPRTRTRIRSSSRDGPGDVVPQLRQRLVHLGGEHVAEGGEGRLLAAHELVAAPQQLDELARVDVRVPPVVHVLHQFRRYLRQYCRRRRWGGSEAVDRF